MAEGTLTKTMDSDFVAPTPTASEVKDRLNAIEDKINDILAADNQIGDCPS